MTEAGRYVSGPLDEPKLRELLKHKYNVHGTSILEPILQIFWRRCVDFLPYNAAPNALTLLGLLFNIVSTMFLVYYSPTATGYVPLWLCFFSSFALFAYQTLDALDGKQARRTGTSSQLGELFDHGCDAFNTVLVVLGLSISVGMGHHPILMLLQLIGTSTAFFVVHWMAYNTGRLEFGKVDVTEAQLTVMCMYIYTGIFGVEAWGQPLPILGIPLRIFQFIVFYASCLQILYRLVVCIANGGAGKNGATIANTSIIFPGIIWMLVVILYSTVAWKSPELLYNQPCLYLYSFGIVGVKITLKIIIAHMTKSELQFWDHVLLAPGILALNQYFNVPIPETPLLYLSAVMASIDGLVFSIRVCRQIAAYLGIRVLHIDPVPQEDANNMNSSNNNSHVMNLRSRSTPKRS